jgi:peptidoglycan/LPS O-acetylase OafA/YrhL
MTAAVKSASVPCLPRVADGVRTDIEGLRAIAVLLVIAYHFFPASVPGGYVGVDVFFVVSGYLITRTLVRARESAGSPGAWLLAFWARRARRLLPHALLVFALVGATGLALYSRFSLERLGADVAWSALLSANWLFALRSVDYLAWDDSQRSALLHVWSLAIEEQFYLVWPVLLWFLLGLREPRARAAAAWLVAGASLAWCMSSSRNSLTHAFFSTPARAWELLAGAALALHGSRPPARVPDRMPAAGLAVGGLVVIAAAALMFDDDTLHPGWPTVAPVLGTIMVITAGERPGAPPRWLVHPAMLALGSRSYALYLWHWPVLVFGSGFAFAREPLGAASLLLVAAAMAEAGYRGLECPARFAWARAWSAPRVLAVGLGAAASVASCGVLLRAYGAGDLGGSSAPGMAQRAAPGGALPPLAVVRSDLPEVYRNGCHLGVEDVVSPDCASGAVGAAEAVVLFGDSHAAQWHSALARVAAGRGFALHTWTKSNCPSADVPVWNAATRTAYRQCDAWREATLARIEALKPRMVILSNLVEATPSLVQPDGSRVRRRGDAGETWAAGLERVIARLQAAGALVVVIRDVPRPRPDVLDCIYATADHVRCERPFAEASAAWDVIAAQRRGAVVWDLHAELCPQERCVVVRDDTRRPVYRDHNHLTDSEARRHANTLDARWADLAPTGRGALR